MMDVITYLCGDQSHKDANEDIKTFKRDCFQVFKYSHEEDKPIVTLGKAFEPATGNDDKERFCKPTDVAVSSKGLVFIADGCVDHA